MEGGGEAAIAICCLRPSRWSAESSIVIDVCEESFPLAEKGQHEQYSVAFLGDCYGKLERPRPRFRAVEGLISRNCYMRAATRALHA